MTQGSTKPVDLTWTGVTARRMQRHLLVRPASGVPPDHVAAVMCGAHAQVMSAAELSIGRRIAGATRDDIRRALWEDRTLIKTFGPRGTVHLVAAVDLPMWVGALSALPPSVPTHPEPVRFTPAEADEVIAAIGASLAEAELTVDELTAAIHQRVGGWAVERTMDAFQDKWPRWRLLTSTAAHRGVLCFGRDQGRNVTYTSPRRWLPGFQPLDGETALRALLKRYLYVYGPVAPQHFATWLAIQPRRAAELFESAARDLERVVVDGARAWTLAGDTAAPGDPHRGVRLLPYFDAYVVGGQPRGRLYPGPAGTRALTPSGQAGNYPVLLIDGIVGGVWHQRRSGRRLEITVEPLRPLSSRERRELDDEAALVATVMEAEPAVTIGTVTVGPHA